MIIMDPIYRQELTSLGFDPETFPITHRLSSSGWGSDSKFEGTFSSVSFGF
tara:strand:- start:61 stop:213 length:153 start_codon:yes stop_codon:yes gene_type:complete